MWLSQVPLTFMLAYGNFMIKLSSVLTTKCWTAIQIEWLGCPGQSSWHDRREHVCLGRSWDSRVFPHHSREDSIYWNLRNLNNTLRIPSSPYVTHLAWLCRHKSWWNKRSMHDHLSAFYHNGTAGNCRNAWSLWTLIFLRIHTTTTTLRSVSKTSESPFKKS